MKEEYNTANQADACEGKNNVYQYLAFCFIMRYKFWMIIGKNARGGIFHDFQQGNQERRFSLYHQHRKDYGQKKDRGHAAAVTAGGEEHHRQNSHENDRDGEKVSCLVLARPLGEQNQPQGKDNQNGSQPCSFPHAHNQADNYRKKTDGDAAEGQYVKQSDTKIQRPVEKPDMNFL